MGLGKTLTAISLVLKDLQREVDTDEDSDSDEENNSSWTVRGRKDLKQGGEKMT